MWVDCVVLRLIIWKKNYFLLVFHDEAFYYVVGDRVNCDFFCSQFFQKLLVKNTNNKLIKKTVIYFVI